ncbi:hypothetical protein SNE40_008968 [Patella caerulea]|uniref:Uncharacterized protein n=1 Tax=Patella caerulea TaxID=87958 RepID=A0AAN8JMY5_PATCE
MSRSNSNMDEYETVGNSLECKTYFPGFSYGDFDRNGCISAWQMCKYFEGARMFGLMNMFLNELHKPYKPNTNLFVIIQHIQLEPNNLWLKTCPLSVTMKLMHIGSSSSTVKQEMRNEKDQSLLGTCVFKMVRVNRETRRPDPYRKDILKKYSHILGTNEPQASLLSVKMPDLPLKAFRLPVYILHSDTDRNIHLNQIHYLRYCLDCAAMAATQGQYRYFNKDICHYQALDILMLFKQEALSGDLVNVHTWQDEITQQDLHFIITKDKNSIFYAKIKFDVNPIPKL